MLYVLLILSVACLLLSYRSFLTSRRHLFGMHGLSGGLLLLGATLSFLTAFFLLRQNVSASLVDDEDKAREMAAYEQNRLTYDSLVSAGVIVNLSKPVRPEPTAVVTVMGMHPQRYKLFIWVGAVLLAGGLTMLVIGAVTRERRRNKQKAATSQPLPKQ